MDWIWRETQHSHPEWQTTLRRVSTTQTIRISVIIRCSLVNGDVLEKFLDTGAEGIMVPMVNTPAQAEGIVRRCYYPLFGKVTG